MVSPFRVEGGDLVGGAPGHCTKDTPREPNLLLEHGCSSPASNFPAEGWECLEFLNPQYSLPLASKIERAGPFVKVCTKLPTIKDSLPTLHLLLSGPKLISNMAFHMPSQI